MKKVSLMVEFTIEIPNDVDPDDVTFDIPTEQVRVDAGVATGVGKLLSYCTQEYIE